MLAPVSPDHPAQMAELPNLCLTLANRPENVALVREMLTGVAEAIDLDRSDLNDIRTAVTEACNNVVLHAYEGAEGPLEIEVYAAPGALEVLVRDHGTGIQSRPPPPTADASALGIGLLVIQALVHRVEFRDTADTGTEVRMQFATPRTHALEPPDEDELKLPTTLTQAELAGTAILTIAPTYLARTVLPRVLCALAARAHFSTDRISDTHLLADALVAHTPRSISGSHLSVAVSVAPRDLELRIAPLSAGRAQRLIVNSHLNGIGPVLEKLTDRRRVLAAGSHEVLSLRLVDRR